MGKDVIFDYSKAAAFIHEEEIAGIKAGVQAARDPLSPLLGQPPSEEFVQEIRDIVLESQVV